jgi:predicted ATPase
LVRESRLVTLIGPGGVGKTRLAYRVLGEGDLPGEILVVELASLRDPALIVRTVATAAGLSDTASRTPSDLLVEHLGGRQVVIYLDNCEHLLDASADLVMMLLRRTSSVRFLASSRQPLGVPGEHLMAVSPLAVPDPDAPTPDGCHDALVLFGDRARAVVPSFVIDDRNRADVTRVCAHLDGIPLAIELAAVCLRALGAPAPRQMTLVDILFVVRGRQ